MVTQLGYNLSPGNVRVAHNKLANTLARTPIGSRFIDRWTFACEWKVLNQLRQNAGSEQSLVGKRRFRTFCSCDSVEPIELLRVADSSRNLIKNSKAELTNQVERLATHREGEKVPKPEGAQMTRIFDCLGRIGDWRARKIRRTILFLHSAWSNLRIFGESEVNLTNPFPSTLQGRS